MAFLVAGCAETSHAAFFSDGFVVYVGDRPDPGDFDPYFNQPAKYLDLIPISISGGLTCHFHHRNTVFSTNKSKPES
jgi:hypothetical protein